MKIVLVGLCLALAGCADMDFDEAEPAAEPAPLSPLIDPAFVQTIDMKKHLEDGKVKLFAFQAPAAAQIDAAESMDLTFSHDGNAASMAFMMLNAPVDAMLARAAGDLEAPMGPLGGGHGGGGGCGGSVDPTIRIGGQTYFTTPLPGCSAGQSGGGAFAGASVEAGSWMLVAAGSCGFGADALDGDDEWTFTIASNQTLEMIELPSAPFACGLGFDPYYDTNILGIRDGGAAFHMETIYGSSIFRAPLHGDAEVDGHWQINGTAIPMDEGDFFRASTQAAGPVGFDVETSDGFGPLWTMVGV